jgi:2-oxo-3-hexenedioate decarboxylase
MTSPASDDRAAKAAAELVALLGTGRQIPPFSARDGSGLTMADAYRVGNAARRLREARGEKVIGRKIGFTNGRVRAEFAIPMPVWSYMYDSTAADFSAAGDRLSLAGLAEPRIEPEIVFGIARAPRSTMSEDELLSCLDWVALGFEIVHSPFPGWRFRAADAVAGFGLHAALRIGEHQGIGAEGPVTRGSLTDFTVELHRNGTHAYRGRGTDVFDGPLLALKHLLAVLAADPESPPLSPGEIVTTGTLTPAPLAHAGETWSAEVTGLPVASIRVSLA